MKKIIWHKETKNTWYSSNDEWKIELEDGIYKLHHFLVHLTSFESLDLAQDFANSLVGA